MIDLRIEKLEFNKVKVTVYPFDLANMNISVNNLKPDSPQLHSFLFKVMERVKKETGFNPYSGQIVVEASPEGECIILTVTRVSDNQTTPVKKVNPKRIRASIKEEKSKEIVYYFDDFDVFCKAFTHLSEETVKKASYYNIKNSHALLIKSTNETEHIFLREFSNSYEDNNSLSEMFLEEHSQKHIKNEEILSMYIGVKELYK